MSALDDIYQLRLQTEENIRQVFDDLDINAITRGNAPAQFKQATPRVEIKMSIGAANGHRFICPDGIARFDRWRVTVAIQVVTRPTPDGTNAIHEAYAGMIRKICSVLGQQTWADVAHFPNVRFAEPLRDTGSSGEIKAHEGIEYSTMSFSGTLCIRESAWPIPAHLPISGAIFDDAGHPIKDDSGQAVISD